MAGDIDVEGVAQRCHAQRIDDAVIHDIGNDHVDRLVIQIGAKLFHAGQRLAGGDGGARALPQLRQRGRIEVIDFQPFQVDRLQRPCHAQEAFHAEIEIGVEMQPDAGPGPFAEGGHLFDGGMNRIAVRVAIAVAISADPAGSIKVRLIPVEHDQVGF